MKILKKNATRCNFCEDVIESTYRHDFKRCSCGKVAVDGGLDYIRRGFTDSKNDYTELSEYEGEDENEGTRETVPRTVLRAKNRNAKLRDYLNQE